LTLLCEVGTQQEISSHEAIAMRSCHSL